jgi:hypothetical protein
MFCPQSTRIKHKHTEIHVKKIEQKVANIKYYSENEKNLLFQKLFAILFCKIFQEISQNITKFDIFPEIYIL